jgi:FkbM family methyltransferase
MFGNRNVKQTLSALVQRQHYIALFNMARIYPDFGDNLLRYLTGRGDYPYDIEVRTPLGMIRPRLYTHHDLLTVNEIFCRLDYAAEESIRTVVDLGSNIGISALYFLTRNRESKCYLYEPDERNIERLKKNLAGYEGRYNLVQAAVSYESGKLEFGVEPTGRYGGIGVKTGKTITVDCLNISDVLRGVLQEAERIDILKIDTEGVEIRSVEAIAPELATRIRKIYLEANPGRALLPAIFRQRQYGSVCQLTNRSL